MQDLRYAFQSLLRSPGFTFVSATAAVSRSLEGLLFGVKALDVVTFVSVAAILLTTGFVASLAPLIRAVHVDPLKALRYE